MNHPNNPLKNLPAISLCKRGKYSVVLRLTTDRLSGIKQDACNIYYTSSERHRAQPTRTVRLLAGVAALLLGSTLHAATLTRTSAYTYDPNTGLLLSETIEPDNPALRLTTTYTRDAWGNRKTATATGVDIVTRTTTTNYDGSLGRFPASITNALNHPPDQFKFNPRFGTLTQTTDANLLVSTFTVDSFGRPATAKGPDGVVTTTTRGLCPAVGCLPLAAYYVTLSKPGTPTRTVYFDKFNREIRTQIAGFDGRNVLTDTEYDNLGRVYRVSRPYYAGDPVYSTTTRYDLLNRVITQTDPQGNVNYVDYYALTTTSTSPPTAASPQGQKRITVSNSQGQLKSVTDALNNTIRYSYDPFGNLTRTLDPANNAITLTYDLRGRKIAMDDPDMGLWRYSYDSLSQLKTQTDAKGQITTNIYDKLGRIKTRTEPDLITTWTYDIANAPTNTTTNTTKVIGKLTKTTTDNGQTRAFSYDDLGRLAATKTTIGLTPLSGSTTYDTLGRINTQTDAAGLPVQNLYNARGYLAQIRNASTLQVYWTATALAADSQITGGSYGNGVSELRTIDTLGRTTAVNATHPLGTVTALSYIYDALHNLKTRTDTTQNLTEDFGYDALNRLTSVTGSNPNQDPKTIQYDALGNITYKSDVGSYTYAALRNNGSTNSTNRPHAVSSVSGSWNASFQYDANGSMTVSDDRTLSYTSFNLPTTITKNNQTTTLLYGADHERMKQTDPDGKITLTLNPRFDLGGHYDQTLHPNGVVEKSSYIYAGQRPIAMSSRNAHGQAGVNTLRYLHVDAQGSIVALSEGNITATTTQIVVERLSYDAWGKRRNPDGTDDVSQTLKGENTDHGYTGHMHLEEMGLIHMNGRVYDPRLARFMQADPMIQFADNLQSFNRYSYVMNNPFGATDPSGFRLGYIYPEPTPDRNWSGEYMPQYHDDPFSYNNGGGGGYDPDDGGGGNNGGSTNNPPAYVPPPAPKTMVQNTAPDLKITVNNQATLNSGSVNPWQLADCGNCPPGGNGILTTAQSTALNAQAGGAGVGGYSPDKAGWHDYAAGPNTVCSAAQACTKPYMADQLSRFAVPGQDPAKPVESGKTYDVSEPRTGIPAGQVRTRISADGLTIINQTLPGHIFHDGQIERRAAQGADGSWSVTTRGFGNNVIPGAAIINQWQGPQIFNYMDQQMRKNIEVHQ